MRLVSTRDASAAQHSYTDVLLSGLAPDGGLYTPEEYPQVTLDELRVLKGASYETIAFVIKQKLVGDAIPSVELRSLLDATYIEPAFANEKGQVTPVTDIGRNLKLQNLSLGPTASFKDMAMQLLGREMDYELARRKDSLTILGATSGDTGSAAEAAFKGFGSVELFMLSPEVGMSVFQRAQMGALSGGNIRNISIRGRFDDCQDLVKAVKQDSEFAALGAVNSINWGRISSQVPYYFSGYLQAVKEVGEKVDFVVPSGNFGNVFSGYVAKRMGLPIRRLVVATNENNVLSRLMQTGVYAQKEAVITSSPSMDISKASNYERLAFDLFGRDATKLSAYMHEFNTTGLVSFLDHGLSVEAFLALGFESGSSTHEERIRTIQDIYKDTGIVIDPHTADGVCVAKKRDIQEVPVICLATALPVKFEETIREALGFVPERPARFVGLEEEMKQGSFITMNADVEALKSQLRA